MHELLDFLERNPGPWGVGFTTQSQISDDYTAGSFHVVCTEYVLTQDKDCIYFYQGEVDQSMAEVVIPLQSIDPISIAEDTIVFTSMNLEVAVENFIPNVLIYVQAIS